jgi:hypothetical protein
LAAGDAENLAGDVERGGGEESDEGRDGVGREGRVGSPARNRSDMRVHATGATALQAMPWGRPSAAATRVRPMMPALAAA